VTSSSTIFVQPAVGAVWEATAACGRKDREEGYYESNTDREERYESKPTQVALMASPYWTWKDGNI